MLAELGPGTVQIWIQDVRAGHDEQCRAIGFVPYRDLWQLSIRLPVEGDVVATRTFEPASDTDGVIAVNNRAFSWHPEQSGLTRAELDARMAEAWFDLEGFRILERDASIAGFCWTKEHREQEPPVGEIYVIAVDPAYQGLGLGEPLTRAGLAHLHQRGIDRGILYVESDNHAANRIYERIGFRRSAIDRAYRTAADGSVTVGSS
jgi:mycothiol synthase